MKKFIILMFLILPNIVFADLLDCGETTIHKLYVHGTRSDGSVHQNSALILLGDDKSSACQNVKVAYIKNTESAYSGILSMAMAAYTTTGKLRIVVEGAQKSGTSFQIAYVNFQ